MYLVLLLIIVIWFFSLPQFKLKRTVSEMLFFVKL